MFNKNFSALLQCALMFMAQNTYAQDDSINMTLKFFRWTYSNSVALPSMSTGLVNTVRAGTDNEVELWFKNDDEWQELRFKPGSRPTTINYKGPRALEFFTKSPPEKEGGEPIFRRATTLTLPNASELFVMMFKRGATVRFYPMNVSPDTLPKNKVAIMNMTSQNIALSINNQRIALKAGSHTISAPKTSDHGKLNFVIARFFDKQWRIVYQSDVFLPQDKKCIILIFDPTSSKNPNFNVQILTI